MISFSKPNDSYPIYLIPEEFDKIRYENPCNIDLSHFEDYNPPSLYIMKKYPKPPYLYKPNFSISDSSKYVYLFYIVLFLLIVYCFTFPEMIEELIFYVLAILFVIATKLYQLILYPFLYIKYLIELDSYYKKVFYNSVLWNEYKINVEHESRLYQESLIEHNSYFESYIQNIDIEVVSQIAEMSIKKDKELYFSNINKPIEKNGIKRGKNEAKFFYFLEMHFGSNKILSNCALVSNYPFITYYPDIVYADEDGFYIDIEIDEPYTLDSSQNFMPIHYFHERYGKSVDEERNAIFLENRWFVIRFSERQVVEDPLGCIKCLKQFIAYIKSNNISLFNPSNFTKEDKIWTAFDSYQMFQKKFRENYKVAFK